MKIALWIVQVLLALVFVASGSMKLFALAHSAAMASELADHRALVTRLLSYAAFALCLAAPLAVRAQTPAPSPSPPVYVVACVDFAPNFQEKGLGLLRDYAAEARRAPGAIRFEVVRELALPNHFTLLEAWDNEASRQAYEYGDRTKQFRAEIQPLIGRPFTERLGHLEKP